jgi:hypothetical protein
VSIIAAGSEIRAQKLIFMLKSAAEEYYGDIYKKSLTPALVARRANAGKQYCRIIASLSG